MKTFYSIITTLFLLLATARAVDSAAGLSVYAAGTFITNNGFELALTIQLVNTTNHDLTVLTKNGKGRMTGFCFSPAGAPASKQMICDIGLSDISSWAGHPIIPLLYDLAPVTLKPNETAIVQVTVSENDDRFTKMLPTLNQDTEVTVTYRVLDSWGARLGCWSGAASSKPFKLNLLHPPAKKS